MLVGGAGADRLVCGPGRDIAWADAKDRVAKDCEIVKGLSLLSVTTCGARNLLRIDGPGHAAVLRGRRLASRRHADDRHNVSCSAGRVRADPPGRPLIRGSDAIRHGRSDRTFVARAIVAGYRSTFEGKFDQSGTSASGSLSVQFVEERDGVRYECDSDTVAWSARTPPPAVSAEPGAFCGLTEQSLELCFDVVGTPETVTNLKLLIRVECTPPATFGVSSAIPTIYAIREDGGFSFRRRGSKTAGGGSFTVEQAMDGTFDASGTSATGTLSAHVTYDAPDGTHYECDSGSVAWSIQRR